MRRIAFIAHLSELSGSGVALVETVAGLAEMSVQPVLVLPAEGKLAERARARGIEPLIVANQEIAITDASPLRKMALGASRLRYVLRLRRIFRSHGIDMVYINSSASVFPAMAARLAGLPIAWHIHETLDSSDGRTRWKKRIIRKWADGLIYASESAQKYLQPPEHTPHMVARNWIDFPALSRIGQARLADDGQPATGEMTIFLNGTIARKGADVLLEAVKRLPPAESDAEMRIVITGAPPAEPAFASRLNQIASSPELEGKVEFAGVKSSLAPIFETATIFVSASRNEALPIAIVEAMAARVPVIATDVGDCAELLEHGRCGWIVSPEDPEALSAAISAVLAEPAVAREKTEAAFARVTELYGSENFWEPLADFLENIKG